MNRADQQQERDPQQPWDEIFSKFPTAAPDTDALQGRHKELWESSRLRVSEMTEEEERELNLLFTAIWPQFLNAAYERREREHSIPQIGA